jgi:FKBP-type peptidyl-prolyl cis-trans isomerase
MIKYLAIVSLFLVGCKTYSDEEKQNFQQEVAEIAKKKGWNITQSDSGLGIEILEQGTGKEKIQRGSQVVIHYKGYLPNGKVFDRSPKNKPLSTPLTGLVGGFQEGLVGLTQGTKLRLLIPPNMGYGAEQKGPIPPNSIILFDVEIDTLY